MNNKLKTHLTPTAYTVAAESEVGLFGVPVTQTILKIYALAANSNAWAKSAIRSSTCSNPTENRNRPSVIPRFERSSGSIAAWLILAG